MVSVSRFRASIKPASNAAPETIAYACQFPPSGTAVRRVGGGGGGGGTYQPPLGTFAQLGRDAANNTATNINLFFTEVSLVTEQ
jgi:hypothetical protein